METETFRIEELTAQDPVAVEAEAVSLIGRLGLTGQETLVRRPEGEAPERFPYREVTRQELEVIRVLYPERSSLKEYEAGLIPLRVLQEIEEAQKFLSDFTVHSVSSAQEVDPILLGRKGTSGPHYLIARWGDALIPWEKLYARAAEKLRREWKIKCESQLATTKVFLASLEAQVLSKLEGNWVSLPFTG